MQLAYPKTWGALMGWMMGAFVFGIAIHSVFFRFRFSSRLLFAGPLFFLPATLFFLRQPFTYHWKVVTLLFFVFLGGVWRFEITPRPNVQRIGTHYLIAPVSSPSTGVFSLLPKLRQSLTERIESVLPRNEAALLTGILYGEKQLSKDQRALFRSAGLTHIVAVSGSNVTIVIQCLSLFFMRFKLKRKHLFFLTSCALIALVGFVGFSASVARAAFMGWFMVLAREVGRPASHSRLLLVAATILLLINPWQLGFDAGFALSFLAMWGLMAWTPIFERWFSWLPNIFEIRQILAMTLAATLMTLPYMAWMFERISFAGVFTNMLVLPLLPFIMGWGALVAVSGAIPGYQCIATPVLGMLRVIEWVASLVEYVPWMEQETKGMNLSTVTIFYVLIGYFWLLLREKIDLSTMKAALIEKNKTFLDVVR